MKFGAPCPVDRGSWWRVGWRWDRRGPRAPWWRSRHGPGHVCGGDVAVSCGISARNAQTRHLAVKAARDCHLEGASGDVGGVRGPNGWRLSDWEAFPQVRRWLKPLQRGVTGSESGNRHTTRGPRACAAPEPARPGSLRGCLVRGLRLACSPREWCLGPYDAKPKRPSCLVRRARHR